MKLRMLRDPESVLVCLMLDLIGFISDYLVSLYINDNPVPIS